MSTHAISTIEASPERRAQGAGEASRFVVPIGRLCFVLIFLLSVPVLFSSKMIGMAASEGVPLASIAVPAAGVLELVGAVFVLLGFHARLGAWLLVLFLVPVTLAMHAFWNVADPGLHQLQQTMFLKNVAMLGGALLIAYFGPGPVSIDPRTPAAR
jgi:putative oxidoreductase